MAEGSGITGKAWNVLKKTASGLGRNSFGYGSSAGLSPASSDKLSPTIHGNDLAKSQKSTDLTPEFPENGYSTQEGKEESPREEFLRAFDSATLKAVNENSSNEAAESVGTSTLPEVAPWDRSEGHLGYLDARQEQALKQMKAWFPESYRWHGDHDFLRFLRAREFDTKKTKEMYTKYIEQYRGKLMVSPNPPVRPTFGSFPVAALSLYPERDPALTAKLQKLVDWFLHTALFSYDTAGRPVVYFKPADLIKHNMVKHVPLADRIAFQSAANETILLFLKVASLKAGFHIESIIQVLDLQGISAYQMLAHMRSQDAQHEWQHNMDFMPELLHKVFVINAPSGMSMVWKMASLFLPAATKRKVVVLGSSYVGELRKAIGTEHLPSCYGGSQPFTWPPHRSMKELQY